MPEPALDRSAIETARTAFRARLDAADSDQKLKALHDEFLSRKSGSVTGLMKTLGTLAPDARREFGQLVNSLKAEIETALDDKRQALKAVSTSADTATVPGATDPLPTP